MLRNPSFCSLVFFLIILLTPYINKLEPSRDLTIVMTSSLSSFEIINVVIPDPKRFF